MNVPVSYIRRMLGECYPSHEAAALTRIVCCEMLGQRAVDYYLGKDITLSPNEEQTLQGILARLCKFEPLQYIQGHACFMGRDFHVQPGVLIPRPETEELVERMMGELGAGLHVLDVGTGSGCIAVTLALQLPDARVSAWDVSPGALEVARANAAVLGVHVDFALRDVLSYEPSADERYDVIVSNPPYVTESEKCCMEKNVLDWEPGLALFVPDDDPLLFYRRIAALGVRMLLPGGRLYFEINRAYGPATVDMLCAMGYADVALSKDLSGNDRFVSARLQMPLVQ